MRIRRLYAMLVLLAALVGCGESSGGGGAPSTAPPVTIPSDTPSPLLITPPPGSIYLGMYVNPSNVPSPPPSLIDNFQTAVGRHFALSMHYYGFFDKFPGPSELDDIANGRIPLESWNCDTSNAKVASGKEDATIRSLADTVAAFGYPIFLRYMWEMNLAASATFHSTCYDKSTDLPGGVFSPEEYVLAWRRIRAIFAQEGAFNVVWVWNPSGSNNPAAYYPGSDEVDWVAFDYYDTANVAFASTYAQAYDYLSIYHKPILVGETAATIQFQPTYFAQAAPALLNQFPLISAYMYYDGVNKRYGPNYTWAIDSTTIGNFAAFANAQYVSAMPTISPVP